MTIDWKGECLPPVGVHCEVDLRGDDRWTKCEVLAHYSPHEDGTFVAVFAYACAGGRTVEQRVGACFRTPEQIQRHKDIEVLMRSTDYEFNERQAAIILDAGYKRTEPEQIAAGERDRKAKAMYKSIYFASHNEWGNIPEGLRETFRKAIDAGWQQVKP